MKRALAFVMLVVVAGWLVLIQAWAGPNDPIAGEDFDALVGDCRLAWRAQAERLLPDSAGYIVLGPFAGARNAPIDNLSTFGAIRVICPDTKSLRSAADHLASSDDMMLDEVASYLDSPDSSSLFRGLSGRAWRLPGCPYSIIAITTNQARFMIWANSKVRPFAGEAYQHARAVSDYLHSLDTGYAGAAPPRAPNFGLPDSMDFYAPPPDYVIEGYDNYLNFLHGYAAINTDFAQGVKAFVPSDSLWQAMKTNAPRVAYPNKEWPMLQYEYRKFSERGGDVRVMNTLTAEGFDTLQAGEYFFAVSTAGKVRFARELLRAEVRRIEAETGRKTPRANHAFLFPGEPVLTAGAFFVEIDDDGRRLSEINAQSGHYFYSNVAATIREDVAERSDQYLLSLGHFFVALDSLGIPHDNVLISKL